jgi:hypothetical protein
MKPGRLILVVVLAFGGGASRAEPYTFTDTKGRKLQADVQRATADQVTLKRTDGQVFTIPRSTFVAEDQKHIDQWLKTNAAQKPWRLAVRVSSGKNDRHSNDDAMLDFDDRRQQLEPGVTIKNEETDRALENAKGFLLVLAKNVNDTSELRVLGREEFSASLKPGESMIHEGNPIKLIYDDKAYAKFGWKYYGYLMVLKDHKGRQIAARSVPETLVKSAQNAESLKENDIISRELRPRYTRKPTIVR